MPSRTACVICSEFTNVPFVEPRSSTQSWSLRRKSRGVQRRRVDVLGHGDAAPRRAPDGQLVVEVVGAPGVLRRLDHLQVQLALAALLGGAATLAAAPAAAAAHLATLLPPHRTGLADGGRAHLHPHGPDDAEEEEEDQRDDAPLHDAEHRIEVLGGDEDRDRAGGRHDISKTSFVEPTLTSSPLARSCSRTGDAVDPRPVGGPEIGDEHTVTLPTELGMAPAHVGVRQHDFTLGQPADDQGLRAHRHPPAVRQDELGQEAAVLALVHIRRHREAARLQAGPFEDLHLDRADEGVALNPRVLAGGVGELAGEGVDEIREAADVGRRERHGEGVGRDEAPDPHPTVQVHLAGQPAADFDRLEVASKRLGQRALHQTLESLLKLLESHGLPEITGPPRPGGIHCGV